MLKTKMLALLICLLVVPAVAMAQPNPDFRAGTEAYYQGDMKTAVKLWQKALQDSKLSPVNQGLANMNLGLAYIQLGDTGAAKKHLDAAIKIDPKQPVFHSARGDLSALKGDLDEGIGFYSQAIKLHGDYFPALLNRGIAYTKKKQYKAALKDLNKCVAIGDAPFQAYNSRGNLYEEMGKNSLAVSDFSKAIMAYPKYPSPYFNRSRVYEKMGYLTKALQDAKKFSQLSPGHPWAQKRVDHLEKRLAQIKKGKKGKKGKKK